MSDTIRITVTVKKDLIEEARGLGINISRSASNGIELAVNREKKIRELGL